MRKLILIFLYHFISKLYGGSFTEAAKELAWYMKERHKGEDDFMEHCDNCKSLDFCLICPGFRELYNARRNA